MRGTHLVVHVSQGCPAYAQLKQDCYTSRVKRMNDPNHARYITFSTYQRLDLFSTEAIRDVFVEQLRLTRERHDFLLYAWVLMPNHAHLFMREPHDGIVSEILKTLKLGLSKRVIHRWVQLDAPILDRIRDARGVYRFWQRGGGYDRNIYSDSEFNEKIGYIHMNPVRAGLARTPLDWAWSSARWWSGEREGQIACDQRGAGRSG